MNRIILLLLVTVIWSVASQCALAHDILEDCEQFYDSPEYKQSVAYDALLIEPKRTLQLLARLRKLVPPVEKNFLSATKRNLLSKDDLERNEALSTMSYDLESLVDLAKYSDQDYSCQGKNFLHSLDDRFNGESSLSSPTRNLPFGPNILAYIKFYKMTTIKHCKALLKESVDDADRESRQLIKEVVKSVEPRGGSDLQRYKSISTIDGIANAINHYLSSTESNLNDSLQHGDSRRRVFAKFNAIRQACDRISEGAQFKGFVVAAMKDSQISFDILDDHELIELGMMMEICFEFEDRITEQLVGIKGGVLTRLRALMN